MNEAINSCLIILAGGQSRRMGEDKAVMRLDGERLIDRTIAQISPHISHIKISASQDYGTGLDHIPDAPNAPKGPVGAIYSIAAWLRKNDSRMAGFITIPVDVPHISVDILKKLAETGGCAVAEDSKRMHPTFAYWQCDIINAIAESNDLSSKAPSLHWLAGKSDATVIRWPDERMFFNINTPSDLLEAQTLSKSESF